MNWPNSTAGIKTVVILLSFVFLFVVAVLLDLQYLYLMAVTLAVLPLASYGLASLATTRFAARRDHAPMATEGRPLTVTLHVESKGGLPQGAIRVADRLPDELALPGAKADARASLEDWDGQQGDQTYQVVPEKRGVYRFGPATIYTTDPLGLFSFHASVPLETEIVVHPLPLTATATMVGGEGLVGRRERDGKTHRGDGIDFHGVREYREGDSLRRVHWPTTARTGKLSVIEFERAYQQDAVIALDRRRGSERGSGRYTTLEYAIKIAATLIERSLQGGGAVTFITQGMRLKSEAGLDTETARYRIFDALAHIAADADTSLADDLAAARFVDGSFLTLITVQGDPAVSAFLSGRLEHGDLARVYFVEPSSFDGPARGGTAAKGTVGTVSSPAIAGADFRLITREDDPWNDGGRGLARRLETIS